MKRTIIIPYNVKLSKNVMWKHIRGGGVYLNPDTKAEIEAIAWELKSRGGDWQKRKLYVHIMVYRPDMRLDPVNVLDAIIDGVKVATGIDDRYYSGSWDWELVNEKDKRIEITISQEEE